MAWNKAELIIIIIFYEDWTQKHPSAHEYQILMHKPIINIKLQAITGVNCEKHYMA